MGHCANRYAGVGPGARQHITQCVSLHWHVHQMGGGHCPSASRWSMCSGGISTDLNEVRCAESGQKRQWVRVL